MEHRKRFLVATTVLLIMDCVLILLVLYVKIQKQIPERLYLYEKEYQRFDFALPMEAFLQKGSATVTCNQDKQVKDNIHIDFGEPFSLYSKEKGSCDISVKLCGIIPVKHISVRVIEKERVHPCGNNVGIKIQTDGILVLGTGEITGRDGQLYEPAKNIVQSGDYICKINNQAIDTKEQLQKELDQLDKERVILMVRRGKEQIELSVRAVETPNETYKLGIWVRDDTQGIGTMTYYDSKGNFAALGHGISDVDTGTTMQVKEGYIYETGIYRIVKGTRGKPGEITGYLKKDTDNLLGTIHTNGKSGIKGVLCDNVKLSDQDYIEVGLKQEMIKGDAQILCQLDGEVTSYAVQIEKINLNEEEKGIVLRVTDQALLEKTGGIIQGMSGSPIIQNGKLIGAVTHVFVNDPTRGYGIFIEEMLGY